MAELPNWIYDVIIELERWRDEHSKLYAQFAGSNEYQAVDDCGCRPLDHVPPDVLAQAHAIREYLRGVTIVREAP